MYESGENYLETILMLYEKQQEVRSVDVARALGFSKPSVSRAMGILKESGLIQMDEKSYITLTEEGMKKAQAVYERHQVLTAFLTEVIGVEQKTAEEDACRVEHVISQETFAGLKKFLMEHRENGY